MSDYSKNGIPKKSPEASTISLEGKDISKNNEYANVADEFSELRTLLLGVEPTQLNKLYERLDNPQIIPEDISRLLPEAIMLRSMQDKKLGEAIIPTVEQAIDSSVKQDLKILSEAIFPIIGPATRKAISTALQEMVQTLNQTLEHSVSPQSFKWRLEARQTGKSFAEVVMLRTLVYRVEQVFLIHKKTGLLLQHFLAPLVTAQDPDLVSAMLTAIQDFVKDSFTVERNDGLQSLQFGELTIWVEEGPAAVLAGIIRGNAPQELRLVFQEAIEKIHLKLGREIDDFQGETDPFAASQPYLKPCLEARYKTPPKKNYTYAWGLVGTAAIALGIWSFFTIREQFRWSAYLDKLNQEPGIIVIKAERKNGKYFLTGMRDPLAEDPLGLVEEANLNPKNINSKWESYLSLEPEFIVKRAEELLQPPKTVSLQVEKKGILKATGTAPTQWIARVRTIWHYIPGITQFEDKNLINLDINQLQSYKKQIEQEMLFFSEGTTNFLSTEENKIQNLVEKISQIQNAGKSLDMDVRIQIVGHANTTGTETRNKILSQARAEKILSFFKSQGININNFKYEGAGSTQPLNQGVSGENKQYNRRVSFKVFLSDRSK
jgi:outer membrane protein OmpA-like peptidoglycan-associated protein